MPLIKVTTSIDNKVINISNRYIDLGGNINSSILIFMVIVIYCIALPMSDNSPSFFVFSLYTLAAGLWKCLF